MEYDELVQSFGQAVGVEKARSIIDVAAGELDLDERETYPTEDVIDLCEVIQQRETGYVSMIANEIQVRLQAERRFETLLANIPEPAVVVSFEAEGPIVSTVNAAFEETFGYEQSDVEGEYLSDAIVPADAAISPSALWDRSQTDSGTEIERVTADGRRRTFLFRSAVVRREFGEVEGYGIYTDITDRKRREQALEHQNEQLQRFVDFISHDLRSPLEVSSGRIELALEATDDEDVAEHLRTAQRANERMDELLSDLLTLAKQGQTVGETDLVDVATVAREAWEHVATEGATLRVADTRTLRADPNRLTELFENLFRNSIDHAGEGEGGGGITVTVGTTGGGFFVADDGPGIDPADRDQVFEEGFTTSDDGTGFGLSIVETIAEAHGWSASVGESDDGGARFEFDIS
jgi:PAS domain S-box-containing protein